MPARIAGPASRGAVALGPSVKLLAFAIALGAATLVALPLASLVRFALAGDAAIWPHLAAYVLPVASVQTLLLLAGVATVTAVAGVGTAWLVTTFQFPGRTVMLWLLPLPLAIPTYIAAYVYVDILDAAGPVQTSLRDIFGWRVPGDYWFPPIRSLPGAILVFSFVLYPYVYLAARAMFQTQCVVFIEAARTLGARPWRLLRDITLPMARPALAVGVALALLETLNDIGASEYLGVQTLTLSIFTTWINRGSLPGAAQIALTMLVLVAGLIALERYGRKRQGYQSAVQDGRIAARIVLRGGAAWGAALACLVPAALGFLIPAGFLLREVILRGLLIGFDAELVGHAATTIALAACATAVVVLIGVAAAVPLRLVRLPFLLACLAVASMGYAIPGTVLALGMLSPLVGVDEAINWLSLRLTGANVGLVLAGSSAALVVAYSARFASIPIGFVQAGLARVSSEFDDAARLLGARPLTLVRTIHLPLMRPALAGAALLVFVDCLKELPMTLLLRPLNVETLSTYIYQFATRGNFEEGALAALLIVAAGILPLIYIIRLAEVAHAAGPRSVR
ncbi:MAG: iron ABC transporter permease [Pseudolabrys sp.]|nr:iron ABC transporter permease [Pseudolabrys sp.]